VTAVGSDDSSVAPGRNHAFDLNIETVLEHWPVSNAVREFIANALDEHEITGTELPQITKSADGEWRVRDFGRGLRYQHLTQNEDPEKLSHPRVIGQFGIGLKDALAVCHRRGVEVVILSRHGTIRTTMQAKAGFSDVVTLHAAVSSAEDPEMIGTEVILRGVADGDVEEAMSFFLRYSGDEVLEETKYGEVLDRPSGSEAGRVYVRGLLVAEEPNFLFSYNITELNAALRRALNRERSNVGRGAYSGRVKDILKSSTKADVAEPLARDLVGFTSGTLHDELAWKDVAIHACRVLQSTSKVVFVTPWQLPLAFVEYARRDGYEPVVVPEDIAKALWNVTDLDGEPMFDLGAFRRSWNDSFQFEFVDPADLTDTERSVHNLGNELIRILEIDLGKVGVDEVRVSKTMRLNEHGGETVGVFDKEMRRVVIKRDQLREASRFFGTLLHELEHAASGHGDGTLEFEEALTARMGTVAHLLATASSSAVVGEL
jgi:hypothetical protein